MSEIHGNPRNKPALDITRDFLQAVMDREDWSPYTQLRAREMKAPPTMPAFSSFRVLRTYNPGRGLDPDQCRAVAIELTLGGNDQLRKQTVMGRLLVVHEYDKRTCPECGGTGEAEDAPVCRKCEGRGMVKIDPPKIPSKRSKTFEEDVKNAVWGVCPTSFEFVPGSQKLVEE